MTRLKSIPEAPPNKYGWPWVFDNFHEPISQKVGNNYPKISVITPSFNQGDFIEATIRSVIMQGYPNLEYIVVDGGSTDGSVEIIKQYDEHITKWVSDKDRGQSHAINKGFQWARGDILCWINSDDLLMPGTLLKVAELFDEHPESNWIIGASNEIDETGKTLGIRIPENVSLEYIIDWGEHWFPQQSTFWRRSLWEKVSPIDEDLYYAMDFDLWLKMYKYSNPYIIDNVLSAYRFHKDAKCVINPQNNYEEILKVLGNHRTLLKEKMLIGKKTLVEIAENSISNSYKYYHRGDYLKSFEYIVIALKLNPAIVGKPYVYRLLFKIAFAYVGLYKSKN